MKYPLHTMIDAPSLGDVDGRTIATLCPGTRGLNAPLFIECTSDNIKYVRDVCHHQRNNEYIKRAPPERNPLGGKRKRSSCMPDESASPVGRRALDDASDNEVHDAVIGAASPAVIGASSHAAIGATSLSTTLTLETPTKCSSMRTGSIKDFFGARK